MVSDELSRGLLKHLPYLRRYARALTGTQQAGDNYAMATMEALIADPDEVEAATARIDLFRAFHRIWSSVSKPIETELKPTDTPLREARAHERLAALMSNTREALLLHVVEGFSISEVAGIMSVSDEEAQLLFEHATRDLRDMVAGNVIIIEDEAVIAMDLEAIVAAMGHSVTGIARTEDSALKLGKQVQPDLVLADIQLADGSSGIRAVDKLLDEHGERPVIFITAFPERLLTGKASEPAFLITKPYSEDQVRVAVSQAMFFSTVEDINVA
ncbi:MAG: response regulator [Pseudomonadota bacterium]